MAITGPAFNFRRYIENEITDGGTLLPSSTNDVCKQAYTCEGLINFNNFPIVPILFHYYTSRINKNDSLVNFIISNDISKVKKINLEKNLD